MLAAKFSGVQCPVCASEDTRVVDSRSADDGQSIRRRRECTGCANRFTTFERIEISADAVVMVAKQSGVTEPFDSAKIVAGLSAAAKGRPLVDGDFESLVFEIQELARRQGGTVTSRWIGLAVLERLKQLDDVAYLRFASVYKDFSEIGDFQREAQLIKHDAKDV